MNHDAVENLFGIEGLNIAWYGIIITFGMILGFMLALRRRKKTGVEPDHLYNLVLWLIPVCILCARAHYVLFEWEQYKDNLLSVFQINKGGLAIYGGILGGVAVVLIYCKVKKLSFWSLADTLIPSLVLGQAIGRWGNFVNQEAYGNLITNPDLQFFPYGVYIDIFEFAKGNWAISSEFCAACGIAIKADFAPLKNWIECGNRNGWPRPPHKEFFSTLQPVSELGYVPERSLICCQ